MLSTDTNEYICINKVFRKIMFLQFLCNQYQRIAARGLENSQRNASVGVHSFDWPFSERPVLTRERWPRYKKIIEKKIILVQPVSRSRVIARL